MYGSTLLARAAVIGLALGLLQACAHQPQPTEEKSLTEAVTDSLYTRRMLITGSRIPRQVDARKPIEIQASQPVRVVEVE